MRKFIRLLLGLAACVVLAYASMELAGYLKESSVSAEMKQSLIQEAVSHKTDSPREDLTADTTEETTTDPTQETTPTAPISVNFDYLTETNADIIGWLYSEDTPISLPVVQGKDNDYYLHRMVDGNWNSAGTLFVDCRNARDFSDNSTVIYGHNMKNKEMFGTLANYQQQEYYDSHPTLWLLTPDGDYQVQVVAGFVTASNSKVYTFPQSGEEAYAMAQNAMEHSTFSADIQLKQGDRFLCLSTCSYEFDNARYVLVGRLNALS